MVVAVGTVLVIVMLAVVMCIQYSLLRVLVIRRGDRGHLLACETNHQDKATENTKSSLNLKKVSSSRGAGTRFGNISLPPMNFNSLKQHVLPA